MIFIYWFKLLIHIIESKLPKSHFGIFISINVIVSLLFGCFTLLICEDLYEESLEGFILVIIFSLLDIGVLIITFFALGIFWISFKICRLDNISFTIMGLLPITYKILVNLSYVSLLPLTILLFLKDYNKLPDLLISFLIYQMFVGVLLIIVEIYDFVKIQTRSSFLFEIDTENEIYSIDDKEVMKLKKEYREARSMFKGIQE